MPQSAFLSASDQDELWSLLDANGRLLIRKKPGMTIEAMNAFIGFWPFPIPAEASIWFATSQFVYIGDRSVSIAEHHEGDYSPYKTFAECRWRENGWLVVGGDGSGNFYVILTQPGPLYGVVAFIDQDDLDKISYAVATSFTQWLRFIAYAEEQRLAGRKHEWPFNGTFVRAHDTRWTALIPRDLDATIPAGG